MTVYLYCKKMQYICVVQLYIEMSHCFNRDYNELRQIVHFPISAMMIQVKSLLYSLGII
jgi:hypothetical protein